jgi:hypothetical protein
MIPEFNTLRDDEIEILMNSPSMVAVLIAGADDDIDKDEKKIAIKFVKSQTKNDEDSLGNFYKEMNEQFEETFNGYVADLHQLLDHREHAIVAYLRQLNSILPKLDPEVAIDYHQFLLELGKTVAGASGGVFGMAKVSKEEAAHLGLDMIEDPSDYEFL